MNIKNLLLPIGLAFVTTWAIQYFIVNRFTGNENSGTVQSGQTFVAPQDQVQTQPLNREVNFVEADLHDTTSAVKTCLETKHASYLFSNKGACLEQLTFKRIMNGQLVALSTMESSQALVRENRCFLVALDQATPYIYKLIDQKKLETAAQLTYKAETDQAIIEKTFTVYEEKFQIDLNLSITPKKSVQARILFTAPLLQEAKAFNNDSSVPTCTSNMPVAPVKNDTISGLFNTQNGSVSKEALVKIDLNKGWLMPTLFGSEDKYFVHALVADQNRFAQRAYYAIFGKLGLTSILEGAPITQPAQWTLSFYCGPKEDDVMNLVDPRLEQTLDYAGWLAPLSRLLLKILKYLYSFLHNYGWAIIVMTLLINLVLLPLNLKGAQSMKKYTEFQKKLSYLQQKYKDDPDTLARERGELISKNGLPGLGGCLPKLLQLPIFFALSRVLSSSIELYKAPFAWIPDLSLPDPLHILPLVIGISMILQPAAQDPKQRFMMIAVALIFGAISINFSAGLCLYILVGVVLTGIQTAIQQKFKWA